MVSFGGKVADRYSHHVCWRLNHQKVVCQNFGRLFCTFFLKCLERFGNFSKNHHFLDSSGRLMSKCEKLIACSESLYCGTHVSETQFVTRTQHVTQLQRLFYMCQTFGMTKNRYFLESFFVVSFWEKIRKNPSFVSFENNVGRRNAFDTLFSTFS